MSVGQESRLGSGITLVVPEGWWRIPLTSPAEAAVSAATLIDRQFRGLDDQPILRRQTEEELLSAAREAGAAGGLMMWVSHQRIAGYPVSASLVASMAPTGGPDGVAGLSEQLAGTGELDLATVAAGQVLRRRALGSAAETQRLGAPDRPLLVDYWLQTPGADILLLAFSTPAEPLGPAMVELFDAVVQSVRWGSPS